MHIRHANKRKEVSDSVIEETLAQWDQQIMLLDDGHCRLWANPLLSLSDL